MGSDCTPLGEDLAAKAWLRYPACTVTVQVNAKRKSLTPCGSRPLTILTVPTVDALLLPLRGLTYGVSWTRIRCGSDRFRS